MHDIICVQLLQIIHTVEKLVEVITVSFSPIKPEWIGDRSQHCAQMVLIMGLSFFIALPELIVGGVIAGFVNVLTKIHILGGHSSFGVKWQKMYRSAYLYIWLVDSNDETHIGNTDAFPSPP